MPSRKKSPAAPARWADVADLLGPVCGLFDHYRALTDAALLVQAEARDLTPPEAILAARQELVKSGHVRDGGGRYTWPPLGVPRIIWVRDD